MLPFMLYLQLEDSLLPAFSYFFCLGIYVDMAVWWSIGACLARIYCCSAIHGSSTQKKKTIKNPLSSHLVAACLGPVQGRSSPKAFSGQRDTLSPTCPRSILCFFLDGHTWVVCEAYWWDALTTTNGSSCRALLLALLWAQLLLTILTSVKLIPVTLGRELISASCISDLYPN